MSGRKRAELWLSLLWNIPAFFFCLAFGKNYLITLFVFSLPAIYYSIRQPRMIRKLSLFALLFGIPGTAVFTYLAHTDGAWFNPSIVPRILEIYPVEDFIWCFIYMYYIVAFYEYFLEHEKKFRLSAHFRPIVTLCWIGAGMFTIAAYIYGPLSALPYFYALFLVFIVIIPSWWFLAKHQSMLVKVVKTELFFLPFSFLMEYVANVNHNWWFPGSQFIGYVQAAGIRIPLEEFLWLLLVVPAFLVYYELLADDGR
jgi:hypothetical protein